MRDKKKIISRMFRNGTTDSWNGKVSHLKQWIRFLKHFGIIHWYELGLDVEMKWNSSIPLVGDIRVKVSYI